MSKTGFKRMVCNVVPTPARPPAYKIFKGCTRKKRYKTEKAAKSVIRGIRRTKTDTNLQRPLLPYKCEICFGWHVGHSNDQVQPSSIKKETCRYCECEIVRTQTPMGLPSFIRKSPFMWKSSLGFYCAKAGGECQHQPKQDPHF
jgi:hypothetical protein